MGQWLSTTFIILLLSPFTSFAGVLDVDDSLDPHYSQCVSWGINHPIRYRFRVEGSENNGEFMDSLNDFCLCKRSADKEEMKRSTDKKLGYFFSGRGHYFSEIDICLQDNVSSKSFDMLFGMLLYDQVHPLLSSLIKESKTQAVGRVVGREVASAWDDCLEMEMMKSCKKVSSLFFVYKCIKRKFKDNDFLENLKKSCREKPMFESELI